MKSLIIKSPFAFLLILFFATSCEKDKGPIIIRPEIPYDSTVYMISYSRYIQPLFNENCVGCHNSSHPFLNLHASTSYSELVYDGANAPYVDNADPENSLLIQRMRGVEWPIMPPNPPHISESDIDSIKFWMSQGYFDN